MISKACRGVQRALFDFDKRSVGVDKMTALALVGFAVVLYFAAHVSIYSRVTEVFFSPVVYKILSNSARGAQLAFCGAGFYFAIFVLNGDVSKLDRVVCIATWGVSFFLIWWVAVLFFGAGTGAEPVQLLLAGFMYFHGKGFESQSFAPDGWFFLSLCLYCISLVALSRSLKGGRSGVALCVAGYVIWKGWYWVATVFDIPRTGDFHFLSPLSHFFSFAFGVLIAQMTKSVSLRQFRLNRRLLWALDVGIFILLWEFWTDDYNHFVGFLPLAFLAIAVLFDSPCFGWIRRSQVLIALGRYSIPAYLFHLSILNFLAVQLPRQLPPLFLTSYAELREVVYLPLLVLSALFLGAVVDRFYQEPARNAAEWLVRRVAGQRAQFKGWGGWFGLIRFAKEKIRYFASLSYDDCVRFSLVVLFAGAIFDPAGKIYMIKYVSFMWAAILFCSAVFMGRTRWPSWRLVVFLAVFSVAIPCYGIFLTYKYSGGLSLGAESVYLTAGFFLLYSLVFSSEKLAEIGAAALDQVLFFLAVSVCVVAAMFVSGLGYGFWGWMWEHGVVSTGYRDYLGVSVINVYFYSAPMLVFALAKWWIEYIDLGSRRSLLGALICSLALVLTGTRACMALGFVGPGLIYVWRRFGLRATVVALVLCVCGLLAAKPVLSVLGAMLSVSEQSNSIKLGYLTHYWRIFGEIPVLLFGQGYNAEAWSVLVKDMLVGGSRTTELTYFEILRVYGVVVGGMLLICLLIPVVFWKRYPPRLQYCAMGWFLFLILALSNPYVMSSTGMTLFGVVAGVLFNFAWPSVRDDLA